MAHVVIDSRQAQPGDLFVGLRGERADGHELCARSFSRAAVAALVERDMLVEGDVIDLDQGVTVTQVSLPGVPCAWIMRSAACKTWRVAGGPSLMSA